MRLQMGQKAACKAMARNIAGTEDLSPKKNKVQNAPSALRDGGDASMSKSKIKDELSTEPGQDRSRIDRAKQAMSSIETSMEEGQEFTPLQRKFDMAMGGVIIANIFWIAFEMDFGPDHDSKFGDRIPFWVISSLFLVVFMFEIAVRIYWERAQWPFAFWNWFDLIVVLCGAVDLWLLPWFEGDIELKALSILRLARLVRLVRMVKLVKKMQSLYIMVMAFLHALRSMGFLALIMFFGILIYSIFATVLIGKNKSFDGVRIYDDTVDDRFGKVYRSMYSLFELMTLEGWERVARPLVERQPLCFLFIGTFIMIFTYGLLNMVVATVVEQTLVQTTQLKACDQQEAMMNLTAQLKSMREMFMQGDADGDASLSKLEFEEALTNNDVLKDCLVTLGVPENEAKSLFMVLDADLNEELTIAELVHGIGKLTDGGETAWDRLVLEGTMRATKEDTTRLQKQVFALDAQLSEQNVLLKEMRQMMSGGIPRNGAYKSNEMGRSNPPAASTTQASHQPHGGPPAAIAASAALAQDLQTTAESQEEQQLELLHFAPQQQEEQQLEQLYFAPLAQLDQEPRVASTSDNQAQRPPSGGRKRPPEDSGFGASDVPFAQAVPRVMSAGRRRPVEDSGSGAGAKEDDTLITVLAGEPQVSFNNGTKGNIRNGQQPYQQQRITVQPPAVPLHERQRF